MGVLQRAVVVVSIIVSAGLSSAQKLPEWLPITQQDLQIKTVPNRPGDPAIQLYFSYYKDDDSHFKTVYRRIKILTNAGLQPGKGFSDVEIFLDRGESLKDLKARTIHSDGSSVDFHGKVFEKTIVKIRGNKYAARAFSLPEVTVGSIVEYAYVITLPLHSIKPTAEWPVQSDLFTLKEDLRFRPFQGVVMTPLEWMSAVPRSRVAYAYLNQVDVRVPQKKDGNLMELHLDDVAPFDAEEYMPPAADYRPTVLFYYGGRETASPDKFWADWQKVLIEFVEKFAANSREVRDTASQAIGNETDPEKKLRKLYARAQQIRNLSFERERTQEERKKEHIKGNFAARDVLQRGYGDSWDIDAVFLALVRAAGFEATLVGVSDRRERSFNKMVLSLDQLEGTAVIVNLSGKEVYLDPGTRFCPYGLLRWNNTLTAALRYSKGAGADFLLTPAPQSSPIRRTAKVAISPDGALKGELTVELQGEEALEHRLEALETDEAGRTKSFEDEVKAWLPFGAVVKTIDSSGWETSEGPLTARFNIEVPSYASVAGKRLVTPAFLFSTLQKEAFTHETRRFPLAFPYPFEESDNIAMQLPKGFSLEQPPYRRRAGLQTAAYEISSTLNENEGELTTKRSLRLSTVTFPPEQYPELKNFFNVVLAGDGGQAVLRTGTAEADGKKE